MQRTPTSSHSIKFASYPDLSVESQDQDIIRNFNMRKRKNPDQENFMDLKNDLMVSFQEMINAEVIEIKAQNSKILESNNEIKKMLEVNANNFKESLNRIYTIETKYEAAVERIDELEYQLNVLEKKSIKNVMEIRNIPPEEKDVHSVVNTVYNVLDLQPINAQTNIYRRGKNFGPIVIEYQDEKEKEILIKAVKKYNKENKDKPLTTDTLGFCGTSSKVYISEALTHMAKKILTSARVLVKNGSYKYCWTSRGNILLRKEDGQPAIVLKSLNQIKKLLE